MAEILEALEPVLGSQPGWVLVTLAAIGAIAWILGRGTLARIVESFHARANYRDTVKLMQGQLFRTLAERPDVRVRIEEDDEERKLLVVGDEESEPTGGDSS